MKNKIILIAILGVCLGSILSAQTLGHFEYFFDTDPGYGNGTQVYARNTVDVSTSISTAALSQGFHRVYVRGVSSAGNWGMPLHMTFYVPVTNTSNVTPNGTISRMEYFFDSDPGVGNGIQIYNRNTVDVNELISATSLSMGFHRIYVRTKSVAGKWSMPQRMTFYVPVTNTSNVTPNGTLTQMEYFFDSDPGVGYGIQIYNRNMVDVNELISTGALNPGFHRIYVRAKSAAGKWSMPQRTVFYVPVLVPARPAAVNITHLEFYLDTDPGTGHGTLVSLTPGMTVNQTVSLNMEGIPHGNHTLFIRMKNSDGTWGLSDSCLFSDGVPAYLTISKTGGNVVISWEDLYQIDNYQIYSATDPNDGFQINNSGVFGACDWTAPWTGRLHFYHVTSLYDR